MKNNKLKSFAGMKHRLNSILAAALTCGGILCLIPNAQAQYTWPFYESFSGFTNMSANNRLRTGSSTNFWNFGNGTSSAQFTNATTAAMSYPALQPDTNSVQKGIQEIPAGSNGSGDAGAVFPSQNGTWYTSFLLNYQSNGGHTEPRVAYNVVSGAPTTLNGGSFSAVYTAVWLTPDYRLKVTKNFNAVNNINTAGFSAATPVLSTNVPHLVVMRYKRVPGGIDEVALWVDPTGFGDDATIPPPTITTTNASNIAAHNGVVLNHRKVNGAANNTFSWFQVDEIRFGSTWSSVTPLATPAPGATFTVIGGGTTCLSSPPSVGLSGSEIGNDYLIYTNAVYSGVTVAGTGAALDFGPQTAPGIYSVLASNTVNANVGWMSNSVTVAVKAPPIIVAEPVPMTVATNNRAEFKVLCTGDLLSYQWFKDGSATPLADDAHRNGSSTSTLVTWPANTADIGSYYCRVSDTCGNVLFSTTNALNLAAPNTLTWAGDAFNICVWDVFAVNAEWTGGSGFFNPGDNVTFDDAYTFSAPVTLNGVLTPSSITVNVTRDYNWVGTGSLVGSATLVKDGPGRLNLNGNAGAGFANAYTGGTIISNGTVNITNSWQNLGTGPVTLAGGTLANWVKGNAGGPGVEQGLSNSVQVVATSTWQLDRTGDQAAALLGSLNGNSGTTLNLYHSATNQNQVHRFRLGGAFTNGLTLAVSVNPLAANTFLDVGSYHTTGIQVYNGPITGGGFWLAGGGTAYLNAANTSTRDTINFSGLLAGSGSINGQLVISNAATLGAGAQTAIGTFTVNSNVFLNGNVRIRVDKSLAQSNDLVSVTGIITNGGAGTVTITNIGGALVAGDKFKIFSGPVLNGAGLNIAGEGAIWQNNLAVDGSVQVAPAPANYPTNVSYSVSGNTLSITWPGTHLGWILQSQTNSLSVGIATNWYDVAATANVTTKNILVVPNAPAVFYRLRHP